MMSETAAPDGAEPGTDQPAPAPVAAAAAPVAFSVFAATLRPRIMPLVRNGRTVVRNGRPVQTVRAGHPDEVWLRLLRIRHGAEKHAPAGWQKLIDAMRAEPVHAADPRRRA